MGTLIFLFLMWPIPLAPTIRASWNSVVKLNVLYFGGHLDVTAGTLSDIACLATFQDTCGWCAATRNSQTDQSFLVGVFAWSAWV